MGIRAPWESEPHGSKSPMGIRAPWESEPHGNQSPMGNRVQLPCILWEPNVQQREKMDVSDSKEQSKCILNTYEVTCTDRKKR